MLAFGGGPCSLSTSSSTRRDDVLLCLKADSQSDGDAAEDRVDWRLNDCTNPYAEVRERALSGGGRRSLCPPPPRTTQVPGETVVFRSNSNVIQLIISRQRPTTTGRVQDAGPYFLIRYDGTVCTGVLP